MSIKLGDYLAKLPEKERQAVEVRTQELIMEERTLRELREVGLGESGEADKLRQPRVLDQGRP